MMYNTNETARIGATTPNAGLTDNEQVRFDMADKILPTPEQLRELLSYDPDTGKLYWKTRPDEMFEGGSYPSYRLAKTWNTKYANKAAFTAVKEGGYFVGRVFKTNYLAHRVIWALHYGEWPETGIDHKNGNTADNRIDNLRLADQSKNSMNTKRRSDNKSGVKGVFWSEKSNKWCAQIAINGTSRHLGYYDDICDAGDAYERAAKESFGEFANFG